MHELILQEIDNPKKTTKEEKREFTYDALWQQAEERRLADRDEEREDLVRAAWNLMGVPLFVKEELIKLIEGRHIREDVEMELKRQQADILLWPPKLAAFVLEALEIQYDKKALAEGEAQARLLQQFKLAAQRVQLDPMLIHEGEQLIQGGEANKEFWEFVDGLLAGAIPKVWKDELVKFLKQQHPRA